MEFSNLKDLLLQKIDLSKKGSIDERITELVDLINKQNSYVTTSSCSGRTIVLENSELKKKGCKWLFVSHDLVSSQNVVEALDCHMGSAVLKFEPFIMHVRCSSVESGHLLHTCSLEAGFRNSGFTMSKKGGTVLAIRSTLSLEVPLSNNGNLLVSPEYVAFVVDMSNEKMKENWMRTEKLLSLIKIAFYQKKIVLEKEKNSLKRKNFFGSKKENKCEKEMDVLDMFCDSFENMTTCSEVSS